MLKIDAYINKLTPGTHVSFVVVVSSMPPTSKNTSRWLSYALCTVVALQCMHLKLFVFAFEEFRKLIKFFVLKYISLLKDFLNNDDNFIEEKHTCTNTQVVHVNTCKCRTVECVCGKRDPSSFKIDHACHICGRVCESSKHLEIHYRSHTGEKPEVCVCVCLFVCLFACLIIK